MSILPEGRAAWLAREILPHEPALRAWLRMKRTLPFDVDDVVQECYAVLASLAAVDHIRNPKTYLFQTARSLVLMQVRRAKIVSIRSVGDIERLETALDEPSPETQVEDREQLQLLADAINGLPAQCGEVFRLRKVEGLSQRQVAERMGLAESTVEKHVSKAVRLLMDLFGRGGNDPAGASSPDAGPATKRGGKPLRKNVETDDRS